MLEFRLFILIIQNVISSIRSIAMWLDHKFVALTIYFSDHLILNLGITSSTTPTISGLSP